MDFQFMWIIFCIVILDIFYGVSMTDFGKINEENYWKPISNPRKVLPPLHNTSVLVTYANNMFGPSVKIKEGAEGISNVPDTVYIKGYALKTPNMSKIKFDSPPNINATRPKEARTKRGVLHLYNMVSCATGCNPLIYKGYGCYCGFLGSGHPVDEIDRCCKRHDWCYDAAKCPFLEYIVPYYWKCYYNRPLCAYNHGEFGGPGSCASKMCECDRILSECLRQFPCPSSRALCKSSPLRLLQNTLIIYPYG